MFGLFGFRSEFPRIYTHDNHNLSTSIAHTVKYYYNTNLFFTHISNGDAIGHICFFKNKNLYYKEIIALPKQKYTCLRREIFYKLPVFSPLRDDQPFIHKLCTMDSMRILIGSGNVISSPVYRLDEVPVLGGNKASYFFSQTRDMHIDNP